MNLKFKIKYLILQRTKDRIYVNALKNTEMTINAMICNCLTNSKRWLVMLSVLLFTVCAAAYQYVCRELPTQQALPVANIHCLFQDRQGYMWYGTNGGGLCRDNGYQVDVFRPGSRLSSCLDNNDVKCITEDGKNNLWVGTQRGLYLLNKHNYQWKKLLPRAIAHDAVNALYCDSRGEMWIGCKDRIYRLSAQGILKSVYTSSFQGRKVTVSTFYEGSDNRMWILQWGGGVLSVDRFRRHLTKAYWSLPAWPVKMLEDKTLHGYWMSTWGSGMVFYKPETKDITVKSDPAADVESLQVIDFIRDSGQGLFWLSTMNDLYVYQCVDNQLRPVNTTAFVPPGYKILDHLLEDRDGNIWVSGFTPHTFVISSNDNLLHRDPVDAMRKMTGFPLLADRIVCDGGAFWIWQGRTGLSLYSPTYNKVVAAGGTAYSRCVEKWRDGDGILAAKGNALVRLTHDALRVKTTNMLTLESPITCICDDGHNELWLGTDKALYKYTVLGGTLSVQCRVRDVVTDIAASPDHIIYFIVRGLGVYEARDGKVRKVSSCSEEFTAVSAGIDGTLWAATSQGHLYEMKADAAALTLNETMSNVNGDAIKDITTDKLGHLWLLSDQYVKEYNPRNYSFRVIRNSDPFVNVSYFYHLELIDDTHLCIDGAGAFCIVSSSSELDHSSRRAAKPLVSALQFGDSVHLVRMNETEVFVSEKESSLKLLFTSLDHINARSITFAYKVEGWNARWIYLPQGENVALVTNLPKGDYRVMVKVTDRHGCWGKPTVAFTLHRLPAWYETWWAYLLGAVLLVGFAYLLWQVNRRIRKLLLLQRKRREIILNEITLKPDSIRATMLENAFLHKAVTLIEQNISNCDYNVECFSNDMCMSRMNLYRHLHALTGQTPTEFMRDIRLKKAAGLLKSSPSLTVGEIALMVGFSTPGYFSKCFKAMFGVLPTAYAKQQK